jgi:hypothetical protein
MFEIHDIMGGGVNERSNRDRIILKLYEQKIDLNQLND